METKKQNQVVNETYQRLVDDFLEKHELSDDIVDFLLITLKDKYGIEFVNLQFTMYDGHIDEQYMYVSCYLKDCNVLELYNELTDNYPFIDDIMPYDKDRFILILDITPNQKLN